MTTNPAIVADLNFLISPGDLGGLIARHPWEATPLGPIAMWPHSLKTSVSLMLNSRQPMWIGWGPEATFLYNDAYVDVLSMAKHPSALGQPAAQVWSEIWDICGPLADRVFSIGEATNADDVRLFMRRGDFLEETYFSFSYSPIRDESGQVAGLFCPNLEVTSKHLNARRLHTLSNLASRALLEKTVAAACASVIATLADNRDDVPLALLYLADADGAHADLVQATGCFIDALPASVALAAAAPAVSSVSAALARSAVSAAPARSAASAVAAAAAVSAASAVPVASAVSERPALAIADVIGDGIVRLVDLPSGVALGGGLAGQAVRQALVVPMVGAASPRPIGALVLGVSPARRLDEDYRSFFDLVGSHVGIALQNARASEQERERVDMLAELDRAKTLFFGNISHEFRTPLTLLLAPIEEALDDECATPAQRQRLEMMQRNAIRLQKLVNTLLEFSRVQAGRAQALFEPTDLAALTADLSSSFRSTVESAGMRLDVDCAPLAAPVYVDPAMWEKIMLNLLSNAFKFTFDGAISVRLRAGADSVTVSVSDTGTGIAPDQLPRLFERFHRVEGARARTHEGSGIGLALVHDLVKLHGGAITVDSVPGEGSAFHVTLPLGSAHLDSAQIRSAGEGDGDRRTVRAYVTEAAGWRDDARSDLTPAAIAPADTDTDTYADSDTDTGTGTGTDSPVLALSAERLLIVDDNADMRDYLRRLLGARWQVDVVSDGVAALAAVGRLRPDLVVSDIMMPRLDGFGLIAALRADAATRDIPVLLLSARAGEEARVEGMRSGASDYLVKPFSSRELVARIDALLLRQRTEAIERSAARRMQLIFSQAPMAIAILRGPDHVFELANARYQELVGQRTLLGLPLVQAMPEVANQQIVGLLDGVYQTGTPYLGNSVRVEIVRGTPPQPVECFFDFVYQPLRNEGGGIDGIAVVVFEVSELAGAKRAAEAANRAKDEFLAMLGHELRNPLAPIITALQLMRVRGVAAAETERAIIERQAQHLITLVDDLLDVSRVAQGKIELRREPIEIAAVVTRAIETASPLIETKRHRLTLDVPAEGLRVSADLGRLAQVIANLLNNAAKYTTPGGHLKVSARRDGADVCVDVDDDGIGIDAAMLPTIFDMFVQERQALSRSQGGLGLGLTIVRSMAALHGGSVQARSAGIGHGSSFTLRLPLCDAQCAVAAERKPAPALAAPAHAAVLIVDDNEDAALVLGDMLELWGHRVAVVFNGPAALARVAEFAPDVCLLDIGLPGMDGYELAQQLRARPGGDALRLIAVTGYGQPEDRRRAIEHGFDEHLVKPIDLGRLETLL